MLDNSKKDSYGQSLKRKYGMKIAGSADDIKTRSQCTYKTYRN
jgi:hypothetical protein